MKRIRRREFLKYSVGLAGLVALGRYAIPALAMPETKESTSNAPLLVPEKMEDGADTEVDKSKKFGMVIDAGACIGCRTCQWACKEENNIPDAVAPPWIEIFELKSEVAMTGHASLEDLKKGATTSYTQSPREDRWYLAVHCFHCDNPPCVKVCPVGATYKDKDGLVLMRYDRCIGCRLCAAACPYGARRFNWHEPEVAEDTVNPLVPIRPLSVVEKCTFCVHRTRQGRLPRCVEVCPVQAKHFGDLNDRDSEVSRILRSDLNFQLLEELNTKPSVWYITRGKKWLH